MASSGNNKGKKPAPRKGDDLLRTLEERLGAPKPTPRGEALKRLNMKADPRGNSGSSKRGNDPLPKPAKVAGKKVGGQAK